MNASVFESLDWKTFFEQNWGKRPILFKKPFASPAFDEKEFFAMLVQQGRLIRRGKRTQVTYFNKDREAFSGGDLSKRYKCGLEKLLPFETDLGFDDYIPKLMKMDGFGEFGIYLNSPHVFPYIFTKMREMLYELYKFVGMSQKSVNTDIFMGNYSMTPFGAHKDDLDNFMFMVKGRRTMRLWDDPVWKKAVGKDVDDTFTELDYQKYNDVSEVFELEEGDLLFWPSSFWHVGEGSGDFSVSANLDYVVDEEPGDVHEVVEAAMDDLNDFFGRKMADPAVFDTMKINPENMFEALAKPYHKSISDSIEGMRHLVASDRFEFYVAKNYIEHLSAMGLNKVPIKADKRAFSEGDWIQANPKFPVLYKKYKKFMFVSACGHTLTFKHDKSIERLIDKVNSGDKLSVAALATEFGEGKKVLLEKSIVFGLLEELRSFRAFEVSAG